MATESLPHRRALPRLVADAEVHRAVRLSARVLSAVMLAVFGWLALVHGVVPRTPEFGAFEQPVQLALLGLFALGAVVALRWEGLGGSIMLVGAVLLGVLAAVEYPPLLAFVVFLAFGAPAVLHLLGWQRTRSLALVAAVLVTVSLVAGAGAVAAVNVHRYYFGPTHPASSAPSPAVELVEWSLVGGTTSTATTVKARLAEPTPAAYLLVGDGADLAGARRFGPAAATDTTDRVATFAVDGLEPARTYHYAVEVDGRVEAARAGRFTTFPVGAASFTFAFASCARTGSNGAVFDAIRAADPLFYLEDGDLFYGDITTDDPEAFARAYQSSLATPGQSALYLSTSLVYMWDDHDYDGNDADRTSASRPAALAAYQTYVPHYPFVLTGPGAPIAQAFTVGRVRVVVADLRSARVPASEPDGPAKSMLGLAQRAWLVDELVEASRTHALVVLVSSVPWITPASAGADSWAGYDAERRLLADAMEQAGVANLVMLTGDAHLVAIDDGTNNRFSSSGLPLFPVFQAAPLDRPPGAKGGPYSEGQHVAAGQFGLVRVDDDGSRVVVTMTGRSWKGEDLPVSLRWEVPG